MMSCHQVINEMLLVKDSIKIDTFLGLMDPNCVSRKTSESHLNPTIERLTVAPPSPNPSNVDEISIKSSEIVKRNHQSKPKVSFRESLKIKRQKILNRKTSIEVAEQREKRVLIQMSVIVLAFLIMYLPFWTLYLIMHTCQYFQVLFKNNFFYIL